MNFIVAFKDERRVRERVCVESVWFCVESPRGSEARRCAARTPRSIANTFTIRSSKSTCDWERWQKINRTERERLRGYDPRVDECNVIGKPLKTSKVYLRGDSISSSLCAFSIIPISPWLALVLEKFILLSEICPISFIKTCLFLKRSHISNTKIEVPPKSTHCVLEKFIFTAACHPLSFSYPFKSFAPVRTILLKQNFCRKFLPEVSPLKI